MQCRIQDFCRDEGANSNGGCEKLLFGHFFPKTCMKLKEFGPGDGGGGMHLWHPLRSANGMYVLCCKIYNSSKNAIEDGTT